MKKHIKNKKGKPWTDDTYCINNQSCIPKKINKNQEEIENRYRQLMKRIDIVFKKEFGDMCPDFEPGCTQCEAHLIYNNFKQQMYNRFVK